MYCGMNLMHLTVFREVMETGSISQAARQLGRTQPAISLAIKGLEKSLDQTLFERRGRRLVPVPEAQYLLVEAKGILDRMTTVSETMKSLRSAQTGSLNIAAMPGPSAYIFPKFVSENVEINPRFQTTITSRSSPQIRELASTQSIDFGFADFHPPTGKEQRYSAEIVRANCFCAVPRDHALAQKKIVTISDLDNVPIGTLHDDHPMPRRLAQLFQQEGATLKSNIAGQFFLPIIPFIGLGHCCSIVDPLTVVTERELKISQGKVVFIPFDAPMRYEYATLTPAYRPTSKHAARVKDAWMSSLINMLEEIDADPAVHGTSFNV